MILMKNYLFPEVFRKILTDIIFKFLQNLKSNNWLNNDFSEYNYIYRYLTIIFKNWKFSDCKLAYWLYY